MSADLSTHAIDSEDAQDEAHLVMFNPMVMVAGQSMYLLTTLAIYFFFLPVVPPETMRVWSFIAVLGLSFSVLFCLAFIFRRPGAEETVRFWRKIDKRLTHVFDLIAVAAIFLLFPHGTETHRMVALAYCVGYGPMQLVTDPENLWANRVSVVTILGAFSIQLFRMHSDAAVILTIMFALYGALLIFAAGQFRDAFDATVKQKQESQKAEGQVRLALAEVSASRDAKTRFIAAASHDLGQPLQAASLFLQNIKATPRHAPDGKTVSSLSDAIGSAQSMISGMLHYLRLEADAVRPSMTKVPLEKVMTNVVALRRPQSLLAKVDIRNVSSNRKIITDQALLQRAIDNLVGNALQHSASNRILTGVKSAGTGKLRIWVIDKGRGVPIGDQQSVFDDFAQGRNTVPGGFGLGLASVRRIATLLGGTAGIDPRWRNGCATYIELAVAA